MYLRLFPFPCQCAPPFVALGLQPGPCQPLVIFPGAVPSAPLYPCLALPKVSSESWHHPVLSFSPNSFLFEGERPVRLHSLTVACPGLRSPATWPCQRRSGYPDPPSPPLPPPLVSVIPSLSVEEVWDVAVKVGGKGAGSSHGRGCLACKTEGRISWGIFYHIFFVIPFYFPQRKPVHFFLFTFLTTVFHSPRFGMFLKLSIICEVDPESENKISYSSLFIGFFYHKCVISK